MEKVLLKHCDVVHPNAAELEPEAFTMLRRCGLGASDASVYLGLMPKWRSTEDVVQDKLRTELSDEEREIGNKIQVRMGHFLEPLILDLYAKETCQAVAKPTAMYRLRKFPYLTINYDGITSLGDTVYPVEAKYCTFYGDKYWNWKLSRQEMPNVWSLKRTTIWDHCEAAAALFGVPIYYYGQIQQQLMPFPDAEFGEFAVLRSKDSSFHRFIVPRDEWIQQHIIIEGHKIDAQVQRRRLQL